MSAVISYANDGAIGHRVTGKVPHPLLGTLAVEPATLQGRKHETYFAGLGNGRHCTHPVIHIFGDIDSDISAVPLGPALGPEIAGSLGDLPHGIAESLSVIEN